MGLIREDGTAKRSLKQFAQFAPAIGVCQWFHFEDPRLDAAVEWMNRLGVRYLRSGISWADWFRPNAEAWFDRQMRALEPFQSTLTLCFTPEHLGIVPHYTSPPRDPNSFAEFANWAVKRYASTPSALNSQLMEAAS